VADTDELSAMMTYPIAGLAIGVVPEQIAVMRHSELVYLNISDHPASLISSIVAVHRPRVDPAVIRLLDLVRSTWPPAPAPGPPGVDHRG
jgi:hypothetical protein